MFENPTSAADSPRPDARRTHVHVTHEPDRDALTVSGGRVLRAPDRHLLALLGAHQVLTTGHLARLTGTPERTVQYRLGVLHRAGLVSRRRPRAAIGTSPYHCWLTAFGATVVGVEPPQSWNEDPTGMRTLATLSDLWLGLRDDGSAAGLTLRSWRRLPDGVTVRDRRTGADRRVSADAQLTVRLDAGADVRGIIFAKLDRVPASRLASVLARLADWLAPGTPLRSQVVLVLTGGPRRRGAVLDVAGCVPATVAVAAVQPQPTALATAAVWRTPGHDDDLRLVEVLTSAAEDGK